MKLYKYISIFVILITYAVIFFLLTIYVPDIDHFLEILKQIYGQHGYILIFLGGFLEAILLVGFYVPGSTAVLLGAAVSRTGVLEFPLAYISGLSGLTLGYIVSYALGRFGWYHILNNFFEKGVQSAAERIKKHGIKALLIGCFYPGAASFLSTAAGVVQMPFRRFLVTVFIGQALWGLFWGVLTYFYGIIFIQLIIKYFTLLFFAIGIVWLIRKVIKKRYFQWF